MSFFLLSALATGTLIISLLTLPRRILHISKFNLRIHKPEGSHYYSCWRNIGRGRIFFFHGQILIQAFRARFLALRFSVYPFLNLVLDPPAVPLTIWRTSQTKILLPSSNLDAWKKSSCSTWPVLFTGSHTSCHSSSLYSTQHIGGDTDRPQHDTLSGLTCKADMVQNRRRVPREEDKEEADHVPTSLSRSGWKS
ncbi:hypothetical protein BDN72DRAFT_534252 [Pluteus cervinus]|uniref:Uncharacterized protein n=1 Tax=Pluteus cervinus TaxID=181527 RepID=A0ACD3A4A2_9AGAR|nr:hypothetical protein BDN72DRAFT_534252 [Pluteus cervinus]